jgi:hypothetical protein
MKAATTAMPARAMIAAGGPITPSKHIQASQDAAAMKASKGGSAAMASRKRQMGKRSAGGEAWRACQAGVPPSSANGMGVGMSLSCAPAKGRHLAVAKLLARCCQLQRKFGQRGCPKQKTARANTGGSLRGTAKHSRQAPG